MDSRSEVRGEPRGEPRQVAGVRPRDKVRMMRALLLSTYEMGRQPFGLASPAAWLRAAGWSVDCVDLAKERLRDETVQNADLIVAIGETLIHEVGHYFGLSEEEIEEIEEHYWGSISRDAGEGRDAN